MALSCCRKYKTKFKIITMKTDAKPSSNTAESGNKSKPLLCEVFTDEVKVIPINKITEKEKKDYTKLVLSQTKSF